MLLAWAFYMAAVLFFIALAFAHQLSVVESLLLVVAVLAIRPFANAYMDRHFLLQSGAEAEGAVGAVLNELRREGWVVMHDVVQRGEGNIDHIASGPGGIFLIETKLRRYEDWQLVKVKRQAAKLHDELHVFVQPVIALHRRDDPKCFKTHGVWIVPRQSLLAWLREQRNKPPDFGDLARWADGL